MYRAYDSAGGRACEGEVQIVSGRGVRNMARTERKCMNKERRERKMLWATARRRRRRGGRGRRKKRERR